MKNIILLSFFSKTFFILSALLAVYFIPLDRGYLGQQFNDQLPYLIWIWSNFDGRHYLSIATTGYHNTNFAYFPLYPIFISMLGYIFNISHIILGILISLIFFFASLFVVYKIVRLDYPKSIAFKTLILISFFPLSFFYHSVYSDSLFLFLCTASFFFARKKNWIVSGIFAGLATLTRVSGFAILPALCVEWVFQNRKLLQEKISIDIVYNFFKSGLIAIFLGLIGITSYLIYLQTQYGDLLLFQKSMSAWGQSGVVFPPQVIFRYLKIFWLVDKFTLIYWIAVLEFTSLLFYLALAIYVLKKVRLSYGVFMIILLLMVSFTGTFAGTPRYMLHLFPGFIGLALLAKSKLKKILTFAVFLILGFILTALFTRGYFIS